MSPFGVTKGTLFVVGAGGVVKNTPGSGRVKGVFSWGGGVGEMWKNPGLVEFNEFGSETFRFYFVFLSR